MWNSMSLNTAFSLCVLILRVSLAVEDRRHNRFTIESKGDFTDALTQALRKLNFSLLYQITSSVYIFEYKGNGDAKELVINTLHEQIQAIEPTRIYNNTMKPVHASSDGNKSYVNMSNLVCSNYYGMGVPKVWERNITGKGVTIAVNDVGIDTDLKDLQPNIMKELCRNFLTNSSDVSPDYFTDLVKKPPEYSNHGTYVASVIGSIKNNNLCSAGIAYEATLVGLKIYKVTLVNRTFGVSSNHRTDGEILARSLKYKLDKIDIFVNAWGPSNPFDQLDLATKAAMKLGATTGRRGLGTIYVVPAGPCGNGLSSNIYTITVNSIGRFGEKPADVVPDASVLISGLRDGNNLTASFMITTSHNNTCVRTFKGVSAAVAQISGIIALGLQANKDLKLRDVQHLLVLASEHERLSKSLVFETNGAMKKFNAYFGFGLLNADKFVTLAKRHKPVPELQSRTLRNYEIKASGNHIQIFEFCYSCDVFSDLSCLMFVEQVSTTISFATYAGNLNAKIISPSKTQSVLMDLQLTKKELPVSMEGNLVSVHFWDEEAFGKWSVKVQSSESTHLTEVNDISITLHGTRDFNKGKLVASSSSFCDNTKDDKERHTVIPTVNMDSTPKSTDFSTQNIILIVCITICVVVLLLVLVVCIFKKCRYRTNIYNVQNNIDNRHLELVRYTTVNTDNNLDINNIIQ